MADLSTMYPQTPALGGFAGGMMQGQQYQDAQKNNQLEQQSFLQQMEFDRQNNQATLEGTQANTRRVNTATDKSIWSWEQEKRLAEPKYQSELAKFAQSTSEAEVKQAHAQIEKDLMSPDPKVRASAKQLYLATGDMLKLYEKARLEREQAESVARIGADSREKAAASQAGGAGRIPRSPRELMSYYDVMAQRAEEEGNTEAANKFHALAQEQEKVYQQELILRAQASQGGKVDVGAVANVPTLPQAQPTPTPRGGQQPQVQPPAPAKQVDPTWFDRAKKANPGMSDEQIRAEGQRLGKL